MLKTIKNIIAKPAPWAYFVLVVALLIIVSNNSGTINDLEAELDSANAEISASATLTEALSDELAIRNDAIAGLEASAVEVNAKLNDVDALAVGLELDNVELELTVADLQTQLDNATCPEAEACPEVEACPEPATTETTATQ